ncbi:hypothetical protein AX15_005149 [Amanita polypyramis BW_CC]|nr:hypothetical protein AX15_005149 [Amanita polypyramis BW_CC]
MLIQTAMELKNEYTGRESAIEKKELTTKRPEYWTNKPWEQSSVISKQPKYTYPPDDLLQDVIDLYFRHFNLFFPLLHRPTFERSVAEGLHLTNHGFGAVLLLVCAVGARYSDDRRVVLDGDDGYHSCGWKWFEQVQVVRRNLLAPDLYDLQVHCLTVQFLRFSSAPHACWTMVGIGIRIAQDVGAHRRKVHTSDWTAEDELRKRAFWVLVAMDRHLSCGLGRPCAIQDEDFDVDYPLEVDDEYWEHPDPEQRFKQPPGKSSLITAFNLYLKLSQLLAFTLRTIYAINKSKMLLGFVGGQWEQHIVAELDSALNKWVDSVPDHLRWDPNREHPLFFQQSVILYVCYYHLQILIHRPFIPSPRKPSPLSFPSLAICTNAARSCSHIVDVMRKRDPIPGHWIVMQVFTASIVLLLNIWGGKRSGLSTDTQKEMAEVHKCMSVLRASEERLYSAGQLWDILYELASAGELPLPHPSPPSSNKRERDEESDGNTPRLSSTFEIHDGSRPIIGSKRVSRATSQVELTRYQRRQYEFPTHSDGLGRLPWHDSGELMRISQAGVSPISNHMGGQRTIGNQPEYWSAPTGTQVLHQQFSQVPLEQGLGQDMGLGSAFNQMAPMNYPQHPSGVAGGTMRNQNIPSIRPEMDPLLTGALFPGRIVQQGESVMNMDTEMPINYDTMAMWSNVPIAFDKLEDWSTYLSSLHMG